mgnify:CR=1 FL=1
MENGELVGQIEVKSANYAEFAMRSDLAAPLGQDGRVAFLILALTVLGYPMSNFGQD